MIYDCLIVGAGPAGLSAAKQLARYSYRIALFERRKVGGLLNNANRIENYLGFEDLTGAELVKQFTKNLKPQVRFEEVQEIHQSEVGFRLKTERAWYEARTVLVASGTEPLRFPHAKAYYDLLEFPLRSKKKRVLILGGGDVGFDYALQLKRRGFLPSIYTHHKSSCLPILKKRAQEAGIPVRENANVKKIDFTAVDHVLIAIGRRVAQPKIHVQKNADGLYFAGDVSHPELRQVHIAAGEGLNAALKIHNFLTNASDRSRKRVRANR